MKRILIPLNLVFILLLAACSSAPTAPPTPAPPTATQPPPTETPIPSPLELVWKISGDPNPFDHPVNLAVDRDGNLYVVDAGNNRIQKFDPDGKFLTMWGSQGQGDGQFSFARGVGDYVGGVAVDSRGNVYVSDGQNHRVQKFDSNGNFLLAWGSEGTGDGQFLWPFDIAIDGEGYLYVIDDRRYDVQKFDANGNFILKFGSRGLDAGQFLIPGGLAADQEGNVYIASYESERVEKFDNSGALVKNWGSAGPAEGQFDKPCDVAVDAQGNVYVTNSGWDGAQHTVQAFGGNGEFRFRWGSFGTGDGQFRNACGIAVDNQGNIYVADYSAYNIQKFRLLDD